MTETTTPAGKTPWHFWVVSILALLWNGFGAFDFTMSVTRGDAYYRSTGMSETMIAYMHTFPPWMWVVWVVGVWGAVIATVLMLMRRRLAVPVFAASAAGATVSAIYQLMTGPEGPGPIPFVIIAIAIFLLWYASWVSKKGLLR